MPALKLSTKGFLLVAVPTVFEIVCVSVLLILLQKVQIDKQEYAHGAEFMSRLDALLILNSRRAANLAMSKISSKSDLDADQKNIASEVLKQVEELEDFVKDRPDEVVMLDKIKLLVSEIDRNLHHATTQYKLGNRQEAAIGWARYQIRLQRLFELHDALTEKIRHEGKDFTLLEEEHFWQIKLLLGTTIVVGVVIAFAMALSFNHSTANRMGVLIANARLIASGRRPQNDLPGTDELAELHRVYSDMFEKLEALREREKSILTNSAEGICSLTESLSLILVNQSLISFFQKAGLIASNEKLSGRGLSSLVGEPGWTILSKQFEEAKKQGTNQHAEIELFSSSSSSSSSSSESDTRSDIKITLSWSIVWSQAQREFFCVIQDISESKHLEQLKSQFLAMVSHDLRSPLAAIDMTHSLLLEEDLDEQCRSSVAVAQASSRRLLALVNNLLDLERLSADNLEVETETRLVTQTVESAVNAMVLVANQRQISFKLDLQPDIRAEFEHSRIMQVLINLISNAIKHSQAGDSITISSKEKDGEVFLSVSDSGPGISEERRANIFDRYQKVSGERTAYSGTGLGLSICKSIIEKHGGRIFLDSNVEKGCTFTFTLPVA